MQDQKTQQFAKFYIKDLKFKSTKDCKDSSLKEFNFSNRD